MLIDTMPFTLERLFYHADVDDITEREDGTVSLVFTRRGGTNHAVDGVDLQDALDIAFRIIRREEQLDDLRENGLSDEDIDRLADSDETWIRGYIAGATDAADMVTAQALLKPSTSQPAVATAGEPLDAVLRTPGALEALTSGDGIGITLALIHPAKIVLA